MNPRESQEIAARTRESGSRNERNAARMAKALHRNGVVASIGTARTYSEGLAVFARYLDANGHNLRSLAEVTPDLARQYLEHRRATGVSQSTLDRDRQALTATMTLFKQLPLDAQGQLQGLERIKAMRETKLAPRAYTAEQVQQILPHMTERNRLAVELCQAAGLRAHEVPTLLPITERAPDVRPADEGKFTGLPGERYTVVGKGGLAREVRVPRDLAERLEQLRLDAPRRWTDRGVHYQVRYDIAGGNALSAAFSRASMSALGYSAGLHGLRHGYAQERYAATQTLARDLDHAREIVSQELGHFRPDITDTYLR